MDGAIHTKTELRKNKLYTADMLVKKYEGKFIDTYPHHYAYWNDKIHQYETVWEVRGTSSTIKENFQIPNDVIGV